VTSVKINGEVLQSTGMSIRRIVDLCGSKYAVFSRGSPLPFSQVERVSMAFVPDGDADALIAVVQSLVYTTLQVRLLQSRSVSAPELNPE
jgi:hypothetical protein